MNIPIWPGSSSFVSASASYYGGSSSIAPTAFGLYDNDAAFKTDADNVARFCTRRLGYPIMDIELQDVNLWTCFEEAITEYSAQVNQFNVRDHLLSLRGSNASTNVSQRVISSNLGTIIDIAENYGTEAGSGGKVAYRSASIDVKADKQVYDLQDLIGDALHNSASIEIRKVFHEGPPAIVRYFDPFVGTGMGTQQLLDSFGWGNYTPAVNFIMMPIYADILRLQAIEMNDQIRKSAYSFDLTANQLRIFPIPRQDYKMWIHYILKEDRNSTLLGPTGSIADYSNVGYDNITYSNINDIGRQWIWQYAAACSKETLGNIRNKYTTIPAPGAEVTLNGADLVAQAQGEKEKLITQLRENLEQLSRKSLMANEQEIAMNLQNTIKAIPLKIYIGGLIPFLLFMPDNTFFKIYNSIINLVYG